jgi:hypothetical protein
MLPTVKSRIDALPGQQFTFSPSHSGRPWAHLALTHDPFLGFEGSRCETPTPNADVTEYVEQYLNYPCTEMSEHF